MYLIYRRVFLRNNHAYFYRKTKIVILRIKYYFAFPKRPIRCSIIRRPLVSIRAHIIAAKNFLRKSNPIAKIPITFALIIFLNCTAGLYLNDIDETRDYEKVKFETFSYLIYQNYHYEIWRFCTGYDDSRLRFPAYPKVEFSGR